LKTAKYGGKSFKNLKAVKNKQVKNKQLLLFLYAF
jgi:hypothetical protein